MLLRVSLIIAILAGVGTILVTQMVARKEIENVITERNDHIKKENDERSGRQKAERTLTATSNLLNQTRQSLASTEEELNKTKQEVASLEAARTKLASDLSAAVTSRNEAQQKLSRWEQLNLTPEQVQALTAGFKKAQDEIAVLQTEREIFTRKNLELQNRIKGLLGEGEDTVELPAGTKGRIVAVDPKWNFVVLNIGRDKGLLERGILLVHRQSKYIGKVRISEVLDTRAIANVMPGTTLDELQEGDQVLY